MTRSLFLTLSLLLLLPMARVLADDDGRTAFLTAPGRDVAQALKRAEAEKKWALVFVINPAKHQGFHIRGTMEVSETKELVRDHFVVVYVTNPHEKYIDGQVSDVVEVHPGYVVFKPDGTVVEKGDAAMGGANGLKWIQKLVAAQ